MKTETTLTALELSVLTAIDASEYGECLTDDVWTFSITDNMAEDGATPKQLPGVISSLSKKKLVSICAETGEETVGMTSAGATAYIAAVGYNRKKILPSEAWGDFEAAKAAAGYAS